MSSSTNHMLGHGADIQASMTRTANLRGLGRKYYFSCHMCEQRANGSGTQRARSKVIAIGISKKLLHLFISGFKFGLIDRVQKE